MKSVLVMLGSNIDKEINLPKAIEKLQTVPEFNVEAISSTYETSPIGRDGQETEQSAFYNAAILLQTTLPIADLRDTLRDIESDLGRVRVANDKFAARTIDIDIAFYGQESVEIEGNVFPDLDITRSSYLAVPLADVAPTWVHPATGQTLRALADKLEQGTETPILKVDKPDITAK